MLGPSSQILKTGAFTASAARTMGPMGAGFLFDWHEDAPFFLAGLLMMISIPLCLGIPEADTAAGASEPLAS